jgi:hypothetical protein
VVPKFTEFGLTLIAVKPFPLSENVAGLLVELLTIVTVAESAPSTVGEAVTTIAQVPFTATGAAQVFVSWKFPALVPLIATLDTFRMPVPVFVTVIV